MRDRELFICFECCDTGIALIDVGAPGGDGKIEGYCDCVYGQKLARTEICAWCGEHKDETPERKIYTLYKSPHRMCYRCMINRSRELTNARNTQEADYIQNP